MGPTAWISIAGLALSALTFYFGRLSKNREQGEDAGSIKTDIRYIRNGIDDLKEDLREVKHNIDDIYTRLAKVESSCEHAHKRIDELRGN